MAVGVLDGEIGLEQVNDGLIGRRLAVGDRTALDDGPVLRPVRAGELPVEARLADSRLGDRGKDLPVALASLVERTLKVFKRGVRGSNFGNRGGGVTLNEPEEVSRMAVFANLDVPHSRNMAKS